jgi:Tn3 transposase DDE domain
MTVEVFGHQQQDFISEAELACGAAAFIRIVLWQTVYIQAALDHLAASGHHPDPANVARLSPLGHPSINLQGRYQTTTRPPTGRLRPLRTDG